MLSATPGAPPEIDPGEAVPFAGFEEAAATGASRAAEADGTDPKSGQVCKDSILDLQFCWALSNLSQSRFSSSAMSPDDGVGGACAGSTGLSAADWLEDTLGYVAPWGRCT
mmetsp:Transcript_52054/g.91435  ORF Transcript_52054/g.91435 Transcript_52054/m.91435 type:complete len:111 (-) Transcript_52054:70-402(-)